VYYYRRRASGWSLGFIAIGDRVFMLENTWYSSDLSLIFAFLFFGDSWDYKGRPRAAEAYKSFTAHGI